MTDTTDQQAVTVAQEDREAAHDLAMLHFLYTNEQMQGIKSGTLDHVSFVQAFARHRLASVSSASAEEAAHLQTIDERDALHDALSDAYRAVCGKEPEWSNLFGYNDALDDIREAVAAAPTEPVTEDWRKALQPFADCVEQIDPAESDDEWAKFRLTIGDYRRAALTLAASPEPVPATNQAGEVERNLEAQRQTIEACACLVDRHPMRMDDNARMTLADAIRCLTPDESLAGDTLDAKTADYNGHKPNRYLPEIPPGASLFAVNPSTGAWHYVNHAGTWQGMPNPLATQPATSQALVGAWNWLVDQASASPEPVPATNQAGEVASRLKYDAPQGTNRFEVHDPEPDNHHSALYLVDPNGAMFNISCWNEEGVDNARGEWMCSTLNAALASNVERPRISAYEINALPDNIRRYIMMLETDCDPSGTIRSEMILRDYVELLEARINETNGCFDAAVAEGLYERLQEVEPDEQTYASLVDLVQRRLLHAYAPTPDRPAALATQPATSQEGGARAKELLWLIQTDGVAAPLLGKLTVKERADIVKAMLIFAATPTPPTLSEDFREWHCPELRDLFNDAERLRNHALGDARWLELMRGVLDMLKAADVELACDDAAIDAALAQVKAS